ncbi:uncharacterized protein LOC143147145 [Ptiloglossa arizonensis]|uniref:uncharacterized protein LOC143147145 n=1 Tax=Ptiloglossa arizonensis TaxID=3350558 RepID=UPI003F9F66B4
MTLWRHLPYSPPEGHNHKFSYQLRSVCIRSFTDLPMSRRIMQGLLEYLSDESTSRPGRNTLHSFSYFHPLTLPPSHLLEAATALCSSATAFKFTGERIITLYKCNKAFFMRQPSVQVQIGLRLYHV